MRRLLAMLLFGLLASPAWAQVAINEIRIDQTGTDDDEYVELYHAGGGSFALTGYHYIVIGDSGVGSSGVIEAVVDLGLQTIDADGFFLIAESTFGTINPYFAGITPDMPPTDLNFENSDNVSHMLVTGFTGALDQDLDTDDDGVFDVTPWTLIIDRIALIETTNPPSGDGNEWSYGPTVGPDGTFVPGHVYRDSDGDGNWTVGKFDILGGADTPGNSNLVFPPPGALGKITPVQKNTTTSTVGPQIPSYINLCGAGQNTPLTFVIEGLPANGTLNDGASPIGSVPHDVTGTLNYAPDTDYSGLDSFTFLVRDSVGQESNIATQGLAVQDDEQGVFISEVMHRPSGSDDVYEFVEIYNKGASAVTLTRLDARIATDGNEKDTTANLNDASIPAGEVRILAPESATNPNGAIDFRCEWQLDEAKIIRVPLSQWEALFSSVDANNCSTSLGSRVLLYGTGDTVLDMVDLSHQSLADCTFAQLGSYTLIPGFGYTGASLMNIINDRPTRWQCSTLLAGGDQRIGAVIMDSSSITAVPDFKPAFDTPVPCVRGACCTRGGGCVDDVFLEECLEITCQAGPTDALGLWHADELCEDQTCAVLQTPQKCCLPGPAGLCANLTECECETRVGGNVDSGTCESNPGCLPSDGVTFNEFDYDQDATDTLEFVELFGTADFDLSGYTIEFHNGNASTNGPTLLATRTLYIDAEPGGGTVPNDGGGVGYLVIGDFGVPNLDIDICLPPSAECSNRFENGGVGVNGSGDGLVLLHNGVVVEAFSYASDTNGFTARGGGADGVFLPDIGVVDPLFGSLQRLPDGQTWTVTGKATPGETNAQSGACCTGGDAYTCDVVPQASCTGVYLGDAIACDPINPCVPRGACCLPSGACLDDVNSNSCEVQGGTWNGEDTVCPSIEAFVGCLGGPGGSFGPGCEPFDYAVADNDVDLYDYSQFMLELCEAAPSGACCRVDGQCVITNQHDCEAFAGVYQGDGVSCTPDPGCVAVAGDILINEVLADDNSGDTNEFIEFFGTPNAPLDGLSLIIVDGDTEGDTASVNYRRVNLQLDLDGLALNGSGYLLVGTGPSVPADVQLESIIVAGGGVDFAVDDIQNGSQTYALVVTADVELDGNQLTDASVVALNANAIDTVATKDGTPGDNVYFAAPVVTTLNGLAMAYGHRIPNGADTNTPGDWEALTAVEFGEVNSPTSPTFNAANVAIMGACCDGISCTQTTYAGCAHTFYGYNQACTPNPCSGACCTPTLACSDTTADACTSPNAFLGGGTSCANNQCVACTTIAEAEMQLDGNSVCITDVIVTNTYSTINSSNNTNFYVQDTVGTNGIIVFSFSATEIADLLNGVVVGDIVEMRGSLDSYYDRELTSGDTQLSLTVTGHQTLTPVWDYRIADLPPNPVPGTSSTASPEELDSVWVRILNVKFDDLDVGDPFHAGPSAAGDHVLHDADNPGITMNLHIQNGVNPPPIVGTPIPGGTVNVLGILTVFGGEWEIAAFEVDDIEIVP